MASSHVIGQRLGRELQKMGEHTDSVFQTLRRGSTERSYLGKGAEAHGAPALQRAGSARTIERLSKVVSGFELKAHPHADLDALTVVERTAVVEPQKGGSCLVRFGRFLDHVWPMMHPMGTFKAGWDVGMIFVILMCVVMTPFQMAFPRRRCENPWTSSMELFNLGLDAILLWDCAITFNTAIFAGGTYETRRRHVAEHYLKGWFTLDFAASIPSNHILHLLAGCTNERGALKSVGFLVKVLKTLKMVRLLRIVRLIKLMRAMDQWGDTDPSTSPFKDFIRFSRLVLFIAVLSHLAACVLVIIADPHRPDVLDGSARSWVTNFYETSCARQLARTGASSGVECATPSTLRLYTIALYWAVTTLTTVGYGDVNSGSTVERLFAILIMIVGVSYYTYIISSLSSIISTFDSNAAQVNEKLVAVRGFVRENRLPGPLSSKVMSFFQAYYAASNWRMNLYDASELLANMPVALRCDIIMYIERETISRIRFLDNKTTPFIADIVMMLQPAYYRPGDLVVREHSPANEMYFLTRGKAAVIQFGKQVFVLEAGSYFGEIGCIIDAVRNASIKATVDTEVQVLQKEQLLELLANYPQVANELHEKAKARLTVKKRKLTAVSVPRMRPDGTLETAPTAAPAAAVAVPDKVAEELQRIEDGFADIRSKGGAGKERRAEELRAERMAEGHQVVSSEISLFKAALKTVISGAVRHEVRKSNAGAAVASVRRSMVQRPDFEHLKNSPAAAGSIEVAAAAAETPPKPENVEAQRAFCAVDPVEVQSGSDSDSGPESAAKADPDASPDA